MCFRLAEVLGKDIEDVMGWSYAKINWWLAYFDHKRREETKK